MLAPQIPGQESEETQTEEPLAARLLPGGAGGAGAGAGSGAGVEGGVEGAGGAGLGT